MYCAIIGDIIESRNMKNRAEVQLEFQDILDQINTKYGDDIVSKFTITIGDEFQGLLNSPENLLEIIDCIKLEFHPPKIRFGIGFGNISTKINRELSIGSDGPAYYAARKAIERIKQSNSQYEQPNQDIVIYTENENINENLSMVNVIFSLCTLIEEKWTDKQRDVIRIIYFSDKTQRDIAMELGSAQSSIQRRLSSSNYNAYKQAKENVKEQLLKIWEEMNV